MKYAWLLSLLALLSTQAYAGIGAISELQGTNLQVQHGKTVTPGGLKSNIESNDVVITGASTNTGIKFVDDTKVKITANSRLVIDDFVFDPKQSDAGRLALKVSLGTVQYASGQIAKNNHQHVAIKTPTATIGVRGTDFAMTVDEAGRSLVVLLPSCDDPEKQKTFDILGNCVTGIIDVTNASGVVVTLTKAFTATVVEDEHSHPSPSIQLQPNLHMIGNDSVVSKPQSIAQWIQQNEERKDDIRRPGAVATGEDKNKLAKDSTEKAQQEVSKQVAAVQDSALTPKAPAPALDAASTNTLSTAKTADVGAAGPTSNCGIFDACGNIKGKNWYQRTEPTRGDSVYIKIDEKHDNTNYFISQNAKELSIMTVGVPSGASTNTVIIRQTQQ